MKGTGCVWCYMWSFIHYRVIHELLPQQQDQCFWWCLFFFWYFELLWYWFSDVNQSLHEELHQNLCCNETHFSGQRGKFVFVPVSTRSSGSKPRGSGPPEGHQMNMRGHETIKSSGHKFVFFYLGISLDNETRWEVWRGALTSRFWNSGAQSGFSFFVMRFLLYLISS